MEDVPAPGKRCREAGAGEVPAQASGLLVLPFGPALPPPDSLPRATCTSSPLRLRRREPSTSLIHNMARYCPQLGVWLIPALEP